MAKVEIRVTSQGTRQAAQGLQTIGKGAEKASTQMGRLGKAGRTALGGLSRAAGAAGGAVASALGGLAVAGAMRNAVKLQTEIRKIGTAADLSGPELAKLRQDLIKTAKDTGAPIDEVVAGMGDLVDQGYNVNTAVETLGRLSGVAAATGVDVKTLAAGADAAQRHLGLASDEFLRLVWAGYRIEGGVANVQDLSEGLAQTARYAKQVGVDAQGLVEMQATLSKATGDAKQTNAALGNLFKRLATPQARGALAEALALPTDVLDDPQALLRRLGADYMNMRETATRDDQIIWEQTVAEAIGLRREGIADFMQAVGAMRDVVELDAEVQAQSAANMEAHMKAAMDDPAARYQAAVLEFQEAVTPLIEPLSRFAKFLADHPAAMKAIMFAILAKATGAGAVASGVTKHAVVPALLAAKKIGIGALMAGGAKVAAAGAVGYGVGHLVLERGVEAVTGKRLSEHLVGGVSGLQDGEQVFRSRAAMQDPKNQNIYVTNDIKVDKDGVVQTTTEVDNGDTTEITRQAERP